MSKNTKISYQYRDASNYKMQNECVINGVLTAKQQAVILSCLSDGEYFIPSKVGLPEKRFETWTEDDHIWFELAPDGFFVTDAPANVAITPAKLVTDFCRCSYNWERNIVNDGLPIKEDEHLTLEAVDAVASEWFYSLRKGVFGSVTELDVESDTYKEIMDMVEALCAKEFSELHEAVFGDPGAGDLIFRDRHDAESYNLFYYNPDSSYGGLIEQCPFSEEDAPQMIDNEDYMDVLAPYTHYLSDVDSEHFFNTIFELIELKQDGFYLGNDVSEVCQKIVSEKDKSVAELIGDAEERSEASEKENVSKNSEIEYA